MTLDKEDIATAKEMAQTLQKSRNSELIVVGNLLSHLLAERVTPQRTWVGLDTEEKKNIFLKWYGKHWAYTEQVQAVMDSVEAKLKEKNT